MKELRTYYILLLISGLLSCSQNGQVTPLRAEQIDDEICACLSIVDESTDTTQELNANLDCLHLKSGNDRDSFMLLLSFALNNCDGFAKKISELNLATSGYDTIQFSEPTPEKCQLNNKGKWRDVLSDESNYSIFRKNKVEHYESDTLTGKWSVLSKNNCETTYIVTEQDKPNPFPPNIGDTIIATTIGLTDRFVKNLLQINGLEVITIGIRITD